MGTLRDELNKTLPNGIKLTANCDGYTVTDANGKLLHTVTKADKPLKSLKDGSVLDFNHAIADPETNLQRAEEWAAEHG